MVLVRIDLEYLGGHICPSLVVAIEAYLGHVFTTSNDNNYNYNYFTISVNSASGGERCPARDWAEGGADEPKL
jgi:hypothetical protein